MENNNEVKKIKVNEIIKKLTDRSSQNAKDAILKTIDIKKYVSFLTKDFSAKKIIENAHFSYPTGTDMTMPVEELVKIEQVPMLNYSKQYVLSAVMLIDLYTNIELDFKNAIHEYDLLSENGVIDYVISNIPDNEIKEFKMLIDFQFNMFYERYFSTKTYIDSKFNELQTIATSTFEMLSQEINKIIGDKKQLNELKQIFNFNNEE